MDAAAGTKGTASSATSGPMQVSAWLVDCHQGGSSCQGLHSATCLVWAEVQYTTTGRTCLLIHLFASLCAAHALCIHQHSYQRRHVLFVLQGGGDMSEEDTASDEVLRHGHVADTAATSRQVSSMHDDGIDEPVEYDGGVRAGAGAGDGDGWDKMDARGGDLDDGVDELQHQKHVLPDFDREDSLQFPPHARQLLQQQQQQQLRAAHEADNNDHNHIESHHGDSPVANNGHTTWHGMGHSADDIAAADDDVAEPGDDREGDAVAALLQQAGVVHADHVAGRSPTPAAQSSQSPSAATPADDGARKRRTKPQNRKPQDTKRARPNSAGEPAAAVASTAGVIEVQPGFIPSAGGPQRGKQVSAAANGDGQQGDMASDPCCSVECGDASGTFSFTTQRITCYCDRCMAGGEPGSFIPSEFERHGGMAACKKWRFSIKVS